MARTKKTAREKQNPVQTKNPKKSRKAARRSKVKAAKVALVAKRKLQRLNCAWDVKGSGIEPVTQDDIDAVKEFTNYEFKHTPHLNDALCASRDDRIAYLGSVALHLALLTELPPRSDFFDMEESNNLLRNLVVSTKLIHLGKKLCLNQLIRPKLNTKYPDKKASVAKKTMVKTIKGIIGAVYLDGGMEEARKVVVYIGVIDLLEEGARVTSGKPSIGRKRKTSKAGAENNRDDGEVEIENESAPMDINDREGSLMASVLN